MGEGENLIKRTEKGEIDDKNKEEEQIMEDKISNEEKKEELSDFDIKEEKEGILEKIEELMKSKILTKFELMQAIQRSNFNMGSLPSSAYIMLDVLFDRLSRKQDFKKFIEELFEWLKDNLGDIKAPEIERIKEELEDKESEVKELEDKNKELKKENEKLKKALKLIKFEVGAMSKIK